MDISVTTGGSTQRFRRARRGTGRRRRDISKVVA